MARRFGSQQPLTVAEAGCQLLRTYLIPEVVIDRKAFNLAYDYSAMALRFSCVEPSV